MFFGHDAFSVCLLNIVVRFCCRVYEHHCAGGQFVWLHLSYANLIKMSSRTNASSRFSGCDICRFSFSYIYIYIFDSSHHLEPPVDAAEAQGEAEASTWRQEHRSRVIGSYAAAAVHLFSHLNGLLERSPAGEENILIFRTISVYAKLWWTSSLFFGGGGCFFVKHQRIQKCLHLSTQRSEDHSAYIWTWSV